MKNTFTRIGRPPSPPKVQSTKATSGEPQAPSPSSTFKSAIPGRAYRQGGVVNGFKPMPKHRDC